jgi:hypothetical protein
MKVRDHHTTKESLHLEKKYLQSEDQSFRRVAKRNSMFGYWVAEQLGLDSSSHQAYANEVVISDLEEPGPMDIIRKVMRDSELRGIYFKEDFLLQKLDYFDALAHGQTEEDEKQLS